MNIVSTERIANWAYIQSIDIGELLSTVAVPSDPDYSFLVVDPTSLVVDSTYQRNLSAKSKKLIKDIVLNWSWLKFKPPIVMKVVYNGIEYLHVVDGQHTAIGAATNPHIKAIPVFLISQQISLEDRADAFVGHNTARTAVSPLQIFKARISANDDDAIGLYTLLRAKGIQLAASQLGLKKDDTYMTCISTLEKSYKKYGRQLLGDALSILKNAVGHGIIQEPHLVSILTILSAKRFKGMFTPERLALTIKDYPYSKFSADIEYRYRETGTKKADVAVTLIAQEYRKRFEG